MATFAMFLGAEAARNLDRAVQHQKWGWKTQVLDSPALRHSGRTNRERAEALEPGDTVFIATGARGASPRRDFEPGRQVILARLLECEVTDPLHFDDSPIWEPAPDPFAHRFGFMLPAPERTNVDATNYDAPFLRALTNSLNRGTAPFPIPALGAMAGPPDFALPPQRSSAPPTRSGGVRRGRLGRDYELESANQRATGDAGEQFVLEWEKRRLTRAGRIDLAERVERVSQTRGDGLGYDILSFDETDGDREMHIEVKATVKGVNQPFPISASEVDYSVQAPDRFWLYRVFALDDSPQIYRLRGSLRDHFHLVPEVFKASR